jgi:formylmethanofuran--tetrahydromethanopterin N-formyltransferase
LQLNGVDIRDSFAEAFPMRCTRLVLTAADARWAHTAAATMTGFATSVIACGCEAAIERLLTPDETPDGRPGVAVMIFAMSDKDLTKQLRNRVGQCVLTCPSAAAYAGLDSPPRLPLGRALRFFGDGFQSSKRLGERRYWRVPVMECEFLVEDMVGTTTGIGGGNFLILATTAMPPEAGSVLELVIDGIDEAAIEAATTAGVRAACARGRSGGILAIDAGNYGGKLGPHHFHLHRLLA